MAPAMSMQNSVAELVDNNRQVTLQPYDTMPSQAKLLIGRVMHHRMQPVVNRFIYPVFYISVDVANLGTLKNKWFGVNQRLRPLSIHFKDYGARDGTDLYAWVIDLLATHDITDVCHVWLDTFPRVFGFVFNPASFWHCYDAKGSLRAVVVEVNNTFGESHVYLLKIKDNVDLNINIPTRPLQCHKAMHVSPFCPVRGHYEFDFKFLPSHHFVKINYYDQPNAENNIQNRSDENTELIIKTAISGKAQAFTPRNLRRALLRQPFLTVGIVARIHIQALRLWLKKVPFYSKPPAPTHPVNSNLVEENES